MTTKPLRASILAKRESFKPDSREHRACSNLDQLLMVKDTTMHWPAQEFYIGKMLKVNADALAASDPQ